MNRQPRGRRKPKRPRTVRQGPRNRQRPAVAAETAAAGSATYHRDSSSVYLPVPQGLTVVHFSWEGGPGGRTPLFPLDVSAAVVAASPARRRGHPPPSCTRRRRPEARRSPLKKAQARNKPTGQQKARETGARKGLGHSKGTGRKTGVISSCHRAPPRNHEKRLRAGRPLRVAAIS